MAIAVVIVLAGPSSKDSGAVPQSASPTRVSAAPEKCPDAVEAVRYYSRRLAWWKEKMGGHVTFLRSGHGCAYYRKLAHVLQRKAHNARLRYEDWHFHEYRWDHWLPQKFYRVARCETGVNWQHDSGTYVSAFGIIRVAYEAYHHWTGHNSPREQYEVAAAIQRRFGWGAWGCGRA